MGRGRRCSIQLPDTNFSPLPPPRHGLEMAFALAGGCVVSQSCRAAVAGSESLTEVI